MSDVLARLMRWMETSDVDDADAVLRDAITEIAGLRARLDELRRMPTLTDAQRAAVCEARDFYADVDDLRCNEIAAVLGGLIERTSAR